jgi:hypothetical protein
MYCEIKDALNKEQINEIISVGDKAQINPKRTKKLQADPAIGPLSLGSRNQCTIDLDSIRWLKEHMYKLIKEAKSKIESKYNVFIDTSGGVETREGEAEYCICSTYKKGDSYAVHADTDPRSTDKKILSRTLTGVIQLTEEKEYENGDFYININKNEIISSKRQGNALIFTSETLHGVKEITKGSRRSLIFWVHKK